MACQQLQLVALVVVVAIASSLMLNGCHPDKHNDEDHGFVADKEDLHNSPQAKHYALHLQDEGSVSDDDVQAVFEAFGENQNMSFVADLTDNVNYVSTDVTEINITLTQPGADEQRRLLSPTRRLSRTGRRLFADFEFADFSNNTFNESNKTGVAVIINHDEGGLQYDNKTIVAMFCNGDHHNVSDCRLVLAGSEDHRRLITPLVIWGWGAVFAVIVIGKIVRIAIEASPRRRRACFPSNALVERDGQVVAISELHVGDSVSTSSGASPYFFSGHNDPDAVTEMVEVRTASNHSIATSLDHYFALANGSYAVAQHLAAGDRLLVQSLHGFSSSPIVQTHRVVAQGLFNPFTVTGDIVVNGVVVSCHSSWFLEGYVQAPHIVQYYQALFTPLAFLYWMNPRWFRSFYRRYASSPHALTEHGAWNITHTALSTLLE